MKAAMNRAILFTCVIGMAPIAPAQADEQLERCTTLSFAPLEFNVPACTALLGDAESLDDSTVAAIHAARAEAYEFAITYHGNTEVRAAELLALAIDDLTSAISLTPAPATRAVLVLRRAQLRERAGDTAGAITDYEAVLEIVPEQQSASDALRRLRSDHE
jgi:hypothetical protein